MSGQSLALQLVLRDLERLLEQCLFFLDVTSLETCGDRRTRIAPSIHDMSSVVVFRLIE